MSLDVYLMGPKKKEKCQCFNCGDIHRKRERIEYFSSNITHNLGKMAGKAGIYQHLWRPEELGIKKAKKLIRPLREGLAKMKANPRYYEQFNADNGWGLYEHFVPWVEEYLKACETYPNAIIEVSR